MSDRAQPNNCPYCGDDNLWPLESESGVAAWECRSCLRSFALKMLGMIKRPEVTS